VGLTFTFLEVLQVHQPFSLRPSLLPSDSFIQFFKWVFNIFPSTVVSAFLAARIWLRVSMQYFPSSIIFSTPRSWPSIRRRQDAYSL
jgi:hypothetical protein